MFFFISSSLFFRMGKIVIQIQSLGIWSSLKNFFPNVGPAVEMAADM